MPTRSRSVVIRVSLLTVAVTLVACGTDNETAKKTPSVRPVGPNSVASALAAASQTETEWGRLWDDVPTGFPRFPGSTIANPVSPDPVSATYSVANDDTAQIAGWMQNALETASFRTESLSGPLEDGGFVLESVAEGDCRIQTSVRPMGGLTFVIVRYGAACPAG